MPEIHYLPLSQLEDRSTPPLASGAFVGWREKTPHFRDMLFGAPEDSVAIIGPPRVGKTSGVLLPQALSWRGSLISASTKPDVLRATRGTRLELAVRQGGDVYAYAPTDPREVICGVRKIHWSPIDGCDDSTTCGIRVRRMMGPDKPNQEKFFREQGEALLRGYFHAAALAGLPMREVKTWIGAQDTTTPIDILHHFADRSAAAEHYANDLEGIGRQAPETKGGTFGEARVALAAVSASAVALANCEYTDFDIDHFLQGGSTLYVISEEDNQQLVAPLVAGLVEAIVSRAYRLAAQSHGGRLEPPLLLLLDEVGAIAPLPSLPSIMAQGAGQGVLCTWASQDMGQLKARWGEQWTSAIWGASTHKLLFGGISDHQLLEQISQLFGDYDRRVPMLTGKQAIFDALVNKGSHQSIHMNKERRLAVSDIFAIPPGQALLVAQSPQGVQQTVVGTPRADQTHPYAASVQAEDHLQRTSDTESEWVPDALREHAIVNALFSQMSPAERHRFGVEEEALSAKLQRSGMDPKRDPTLRGELEAIAVLNSLHPGEHAAFRKRIVQAFGSGAIAHFSYTSGLTADHQRHGRDAGPRPQAEAKRQRPPASRREGSEPQARPAQPQPDGRETRPSAPKRAGGLEFQRRTPERY